jgi:membrane associated rhomboid family serine protease
VQIKSWLLTRILLHGGTGFPFVSLGLALSCIVISLPQYFHPNLYTVLSFLPANPRWWQFFTFQFSHGEPVMGVPHLISDVLSILFFGTIIERLLGSGRFIVLSLATFSTCFICVELLGSTVANGASGIFWGYLVFILPVLMWIWKKEQSKVFQDIFYDLAGVNALFMIIGVAIFSWITTHTIINNTNIVHSVSVITAVPLFFLWRKPLEENLDHVENGLPINRGFRLGNQLALVASLSLLLFNVIIANAAWAGSIVYDPCEGSPQVVSITPPSGDLLSLNNDQHGIIINFNRPMDPIVGSVRKDIFYLDNQAPLDFTLDWSSPETLVAQFNREVYIGEQIKIVIDGMKDTRGLAVCKPIMLEYK